MIRSFRSPLAASIALHCGVAALLLLFAAHLSSVPLPIARGGIEIMLAPPEPVVAIPPPTPEPPPLAQAEAPPPIVNAEPEPLPPPRPQSKPVVKRPPPNRPPQPVQVAPAEPPPPAPVQTAAIPQPAAPPGPLVSAGYRAALSAWLEGHKHYPDRARARGEEGRALLRFRVDRSGRVLDYAVVQSTGHPDLDAAIDRMMRGASLPAFPADMAASEVEFSVPIRFALAR